MDVTDHVTEDEVVAEETSARETALQTLADLACGQKNNNRTVSLTIHDCPPRAFDALEGRVNANAGTVWKVAYLGPGVEATLFLDTNAKEDPTAEFTDPGDDNGVVF